MGNHFSDYPNARAAIGNRCSDYPISGSMPGRWSATATIPDMPGCYGLPNETFIQGHPNIDALLCQ